MKKTTKDTIRVTNVKFQSSKYVIFTGIPIDKNSQLRTAGTRIVSIKSRLELLPVLPSKGQVWNVMGSSFKSNFVQGVYEIKQTTYENPLECECTLPEYGEELIQFIANEKDFKGIGLVKARLLWDCLGDKFHDILSRDTPAARKQLRTILSEESTDSLYLGYEKYKNLSSCNWLTKHKIPSVIQQRLLKLHSSKAIDKLQENPYLLIGLGMTFEEVDTLAFYNHQFKETDIRLETSPENKFNIEPNDPKRLVAAIEVAIRMEVAKGHTYTSRARINPIILTLLKKTPWLYNEVFAAGYERAQFVIDKENYTFHPIAQLVMETTVAKRLLKLSSTQDFYSSAVKSAYMKAISELTYKLTNRQSQAIIASLGTALACITGGAGTGKTTVLKTVLKAYHQLSFEIHAVALSGRAAMRLHESTGFHTKTIAAFLRSAPLDSNKPTLLVIDEASMIDLPTMYRLIVHTSPTVRLLLTGDPDQLPPIGCGKILSDIVESGVITNTKLDIVKRQKSSTGIPEYSQKVNLGEVPDTLTTGSIIFHDTPKSQIKQRCMEIFCLAPKNSRVIGPTREMVLDINKAIQTELNSAGRLLQFKMDGEQYYRNLKQGDAILFTQNIYDKEIQNGSLGALTSVEANSNKLGEVTLEVGKVIDITPDVLDAMELGYCITLHKAQGSQFERIIIAFKQGNIVDRSWLYTAITRAEKEVHIIGSKEEFKAVIEATSNSYKRNSWLLNLLRRGSITT